jgi:hypothetical protein
MGVVGWAGFERKGASLGLGRAGEVLEVFLDLNFSAPGRSPDVDAAVALAYADRVLDEFAPGPDHSGRR